MLCVCAFECPFVVVWMYVYYRKYSWMCSIIFLSSVVKTEEACPYSLHTCQSWSGNMNNPHHYESIAECYDLRGIQNDWMNIISSNFLSMHLSVKNLLVSVLGDLNLFSIYQYFYHSYYWQVWTQRTCIRMCASKTLEHYHRLSAEICQCHNIFSTF